MFLTGPGVVREAIGEDVTTHSLGGTRVHERNGVCDLAAPTDAAAALVARDLIGYLVEPFGGDGPIAARAAAGADSAHLDAARRAAASADPGRFVPSAPRKTYDV